MAFESFNSVGGFTVGIPPTPVINENGVATLVGLQVSGLAILGNVGNVRLYGGENGYFLQTDGEGRLTWAPAGNSGNGNGVPGGANSQVQFNDDGNFGGDAGFTYDRVNNILTVTGNIVSYDSTNSGTVTSNNFVGNILTVANINATRITATGNLSVGNASLGNLATANFYVGNGSLLTGIVAASGNYSNFAGTVTGSNQPNITAIGTLLNLSVTGNANVGNLSANLVNTNLIPSANVTYNLGNNTNRWKDLYLAGNTIYLGDSVLTSNGSSLIVNGGSGNIIANNISTIPGANVIGQVPNALVSGTVYTNVQPNITSLGTLTSLTVNGNAVLGTVSNVHIQGGSSGQVLTTNGNGTLSWQSAPAATTASYVTANYQPNITSTGTLTVLTVEGESTLGPAGNIKISGGNTGYILSTDGSGNLSWTAPANGGGIGGTNTQVQFNNQGSFGADGNLTYDITTGLLSANITSNTIDSNIANIVDLSVSNIANLGDVANVKIAGGSDGYVLSTDGTGNLTFKADSTNLPGGSNTQIQYNDGNTFNGSAALTFDNTSNTVQVDGHLIANTFQMGSGSYTFSNSFVFFATTASTGVDQILWDIPIANVNAVDFNIYGTCNNQDTTQSAKISSLARGNTVVYNEYAGLTINGGVGSFSVAFNPGDSTIQLLVTPDASDLTEYNLMITVYSNYP